MPTYGPYSSIESETTLLLPPSAGPGVYRLFLLAPEVVFRARVNSPSAPTYPIDFIPFDGVTVGAYTDVKSLMRVAIGSAPGLADYGYQRVRVNSEATKIHVGRSSQGRLAGELDLVDNAYITAYNLLEVWGRVPHIDVGNPDAPAQLKDADLDYATHGVNIPPVANMGAGFAATIDPNTSVVTVNFNGSTSFAVADGATIASYLWDVDDGTITAGADTDASITATFPAGFRWVSLTVTDSNGASMVARAPVYARDPENDTTVQAWQFESVSYTPSGQRVRVRVRSVIDLTSYPDGTLAMIWYGEPSVPASRAHMKFIGWHDANSDSMQAQREATLRDTVLDLIDVGGRLSAIFGFSQLLEVPRHPETVPSAWHQMPNPNINKFVHYLLFWHSTALQLADYTPSVAGAEHVFTIKDADAASIWEQVDRLVRAMTPDHYLLCDRLGRLAVRPDPMLQPVGERTPAVQATLTDADWTDIQYTYRHTPRVHWLWSSGVRAEILTFATIEDLTKRLKTFFSLAPGTAPGQGEMEQTIGNKLVLSQLVLNSTEGNRYARLNAPLSRIRLTLAYGNDLGIDPALMQWLLLTVGAANRAQRGIPFASARLLPWEVSVRFDHRPEGLVKTVEILAERETVGSPALTYIPPQTTNTPETGLPDDYHDNNPGDLLPPPGPPDDGLTSGQERVVVIDNSGTGNFIYRTFDFQTPSGSGGPSWEVVALTTGETNHFSWVVDPFSPGYIGTGQSIDGWVAGNDGIFKLTNLFGATTAAEVRTFAESAVAASFHWRTIGASFGQYFATLTDNPWLLCISYYGDTAGHEGTWATYSLNGGATWSNEVQISEFYHSSPDAFAPIALWMSPRTPGYALACAYSATGDPPTGAAYVTYDWGETWGLYASGDPPMDPDEPVPYWAVRAPGGAADPPTITWGSTITISKNASAPPLDLTEFDAALLIAPPNTQKVTLSVTYSALATVTPDEDAGSGNVAINAEVDFPSAELTQTTDFSNPGTTSYTSAGETPVGESASLVWEAIDTWPTELTDPDRPIDDHPVNVSEYPRGQVGAGAVASLGWAASGVVSMTLEILTIELENGHIYTPPAMIAGVIDPVHALAGSIHIPWPDNESETLIFHGALDLTSNREYRLIRVDGSTITDVSPEDDGILYGVNRNGFTVRTYDSDRTYVVTGAVGNDTSGSVSDDVHAVFVSDDGGATWTLALGPLTNANAPAGISAAFAGDNPNVLFIWGPPDTISYSDDFGVTVDDRMGDLANIDGAIGIAGGAGMKHIDWMVIVPGRLRPARHGSKEAKRRNWYRDQKSETHTTIGGRGHVGRLMKRQPPKRKR